MKQLYLSTLFLTLNACLLYGQNWSQEGPSLSEAMLSEEVSRKGPSFQWPWQAARTDFFGWWFNGIERRLLESFEFRPGVRYVFQTSELGYVADETVLGGEIVIDDDLLNAVDFPSIIESRLRATRIELPTGFLQRTTRGWTSMAQQELNLAGVRLRATYWSGALAPRQFPQP